ncbi:MAG: ABC transporter permease, partial [Longimicrobiales bacterium]
MMQDIRFILRSLLRARGFTIAVVLTLGLGIGANTAIFSVVRGVLLRPLPHRDGDRLMYLRHSVDGVGGENILFSVPEIEDYRNSSGTLGGIAEYSPMTFTMVTESDATRIDVGLVTGNYLSVMGLAPVIGRVFDEGDDGTGAAPVMILTHEFWQDRFGADPAIVGQSLRIGGHAVTVIGVLEPAPYFPGRIDALMNMVNSEHHLSAMMVTGRTHRMTEMIARLAPAVSVEQALTEVAEITRRVHADHPEAYAGGYRVTMTPFQEVLGQDARLTLLLLMGAALFVLVIACANVGNLTLMRGVRREHELLVRAALGAGAGRLRRLLLTENLLLALAGALLGLVLAYGGLGMLVAFASRFSTRAGEIHVDAVVLGFTAALAGVVALLLSFAPGVARETGLGSALTAATSRTTGGLGRRRLQRALVVTQVAVSVVLLTGAGLLTRTMQRLALVDTGLNAGNVLTMEVPRDFEDGATDAHTISEYQRMQSRLAALPGVSQVGFGSTIPLRSAGFMLEIIAEGHPIAPGQPMPRAEYRTAGPDYFTAAGIPLLAGRTFDATDRAGTARVAVLNQALAEQLFGDENPIGRRVAWTGEVLEFIPVSGDWRTVVGVVGNTRDGGLDAPPLPVMFMPFAQEAFPSGGFVIRSRGDVASLGLAATRVIRDIAPEQPVENVLTVSEIRDESVGPRRLNAMLVGSFAGLALIVAAIGIAAVLAFSVSARTQEIGIRMSLGADAGAVHRMVLGEGGVLVVLGLAVGVVGAIALARLIEGLLFGVAPYDPITIAAVAALMAAVGVAACWVPAARAARVPPGV